MQKITILGLAVAISMMSCIVPVAEAEPIPSPYQQVRDGVPIGEIMCAGDRMLMLSPSGMPACVFAESVEVLERRGFVLLSEMPRDDLSAKQPGASEKAGGTGSPDASKTGDRPFVTTWRTASPNESITIPVGSSTGAYTVDWGDGTVTSVTGDASHAYANPGVHQVVISGDFTRIYLIGSPNAEKLQSIDQWGDIQWESMNSTFGGATNMVYRATDVPDLSGVTDMDWMFSGAASFNGDISEWDVSGVTGMSQMFAGADSFNGDISPWDVSGVTDMSGMFAGASSFNGDISPWDVSGVTDMSGMFAFTASFNGDISPWDVSGVTDMSGMFAGAASFNGDISPWDVSGVTGMSRMFANAASFNGDISEWDVSGVTGMSGMFFDATSFNGDISPWDVSGVTGMHEMFHGARSFNSDLSPWDVSSVTDMYTMFAYADSFNGDISEWDVSGVTDMSQMFLDADSFTQNLGSWYITLDNTSISVGDGTEVIGNIAAQNWFLDLQDITYEIGSSGDSALFEIDGDALKIKPSADYSGKTEYVVTVTSTGGFSINNFRVISVTVTGAGDIRFEQAQADAAPFITTWRTVSPNESITIPVGGSTGAYTVDWGDGTVTSATGDASHAYADPGEHQVVISGNFTRIHLIDVYNAQKLQSIDQWGDIQWESMNSAFWGATNMVYCATDVPDLSGVTDMYAMFAYANSFNGDISEWDVSGVTDMSAMFAYATSFNSDLSPWDVSGVTGMHEMFHTARSFNSDLSPWDVSGVTDMSSMFSDAASFNGDISPWDVSGVTDMSRMFVRADSFNGDISEWDVSGVTDMSAMFRGADSFNGDISEWDVSGVTDMSAMFLGAFYFNSDISEWDVSGVTDMSEMFLAAFSFTQDLGSWYITLDDTSIDDGDATRAVGNISAQNSFLGGQSLRYSIAPGGDGDAFEIDGTVLKLKSTPNYASKSSYTVTISSTGVFGTYEQALVEGNPPLAVTTSSTGAFVTSNSETFKIRVV